MLIDLLVELLLRFLAEPSKFSVNRERRRQMRQLLKRARTLVQEGEYERPRVLLGAALALRPDTKRLVADATQMREELARNRKEETMNIGPEPQQPGGGVPQVYALMSSTRRILGSEQPLLCISRVRDRLPRAIRRRSTISQP